MAGQEGGPRNLLLLQRADRRCGCVGDNIVGMLRAKLLLRLLRRALMVLSHMAEHLLRPQSLLIPVAIKKTCFVCVMSLAVIYLAVDIFGCDILRVQWHDDIDKAGGCRRILTVSCSTVIFNGTVVQQH